MLSSLSRPPSARAVLAGLVVLIVVASALVIRSGLREPPSADPFRPAVATGLIRGDRPNGFLRRLAFSSDLRVVTSVPELPRTYWIGGSGGLLAVTRDGGESWSHSTIPDTVLPGETSPTVPEVIDIRFQSDGWGYALDNYGRLFETKNGGSTWTRASKAARPLARVVGAVVQLPPTPKDRLAPVMNYHVPKDYPVVQWFSGGAALGLRTDGKLFQTANNGKRWDPVALPLELTTGQLNGRVVGLTGAGAGVLHVWFDLGGDSTRVLRGTRLRDGGFHWQLAGESPYRVLQIDAQSADTAWAITRSGYILRTDDGWARVERSSAPGGLRLNRAHFATSHHGLAVGDDGTLLRSADGGVVWEVLAGGGDRLSSVSFASRRTGWAVGNWGTVLKSSDAGRRWKPQNSGTRESLHDVWAHTERRAVAVGDAGTAIRTYDGGTTWLDAFEVALPPEVNQRNPSLTALFFEDGRYGWAVGTHGVVLSSRDGGASWEQASRPLAGNLTDIHFSAWSRGWIVSDSGIVYGTQDGGKTWGREFIGSGKLNSVHGIGDRAWAVGEQGRILRRDAGTWKEGSSPVRSGLNTVLFTTADSGWAAGDDGTVVRTTNGGTTWTAVSPVSSTELMDLASASGGRIWAVGAAGVIVRRDTGAVIRQIARKGVLWPVWSTYVTLLGLVVLLFLAWRTGKRGPYVVGSGVADALANDRPLDAFDERARKRFLPFARTISRLLRNTDTAPPLTLAVTGRWGEGKTSLMNLIREEMHGSGARVVMFNAWQHQTEEHLLAALLESVREEGVPSALSSPRTALAFRARLLATRVRNHRPAAVVALLLIAVYLAFLYGTVPGAEFRENFALLLPESCRGIGSCVNFSLAQLSTNAVSVALLGGALITLFQSIKSFGVLPGSILAKLGELTRVRPLAGETSVRQRFAREFRDVTTALGPNKLVIFVDDLDRCRPPHVINVLEAIHFLASAGQCIVLLGMDSDRVVRAVAAGFGEDADRLWVPEEPGPPQEGNSADPQQLEGRRLDHARAYLDKVINFQVPLPPVDREAVGGFFTPQLGTQTSRGMPRTVWRSARSLMPTGVLLIAAVLGTRWLFGSTAAAPHPVDALSIPTASSVMAFVEESAPSPASAASAGSALERSEEPRREPDSIAATSPAVSRPAAVLAFDNNADSWPVLVRLAFGALLFGALYLWGRGDPVVEDSRDFRRALNVWAPYLGRLYQNPRAAKKFVNRVRYYSMSSRAPGHFGPLKRRLPFIRAKAACEPSRFRDADLVALAALYERDPGLLNENTYAHFRDTIYQCLIPYLKDDPDRMRELELLEYSARLIVLEVDDYYPADDFLKLRQRFQIHVGNGEPGTAT